MVVFSRLELLNQKELLEQAIFGKELLEKQLSYLLSSLRKMSQDITTSWKKLMEKDSLAIRTMANAISEETSFIEQTAKVQPEKTIAYVIKEQTAGLTIPKVEIIEVQKNKEISIPITVSFSIDATIDEFEDYYNEILNYVDRIINLQRLVKKIKKTRRQLTMLEEKVIPELQVNMNMILFTLNQRELEEKIRLMKVSKKMSNKMER